MGIGDWGFQSPIPNPQKNMHQNKYNYNKKLKFKNK